MSLSAITSPFFTTIVPSCLTTGPENTTQLAALDVGDGLLGHLLHVVGHVLQRLEQHIVLGHAGPGLVRLPGAVEDRLDLLDVIRSPIVDERSKLRMRPELQHVGGLAEGVDVALLGDLHRGRRVGVLHEHVGALIDQRLGGVGFLAGIEPGVDPHDLDLEVRD